MQQWAMILSAYSYKIEYIPVPANQCADCLSCLPVEWCVIHPAEDGNAIHAIHTITPPVTATEIANHTAKDKTLSQVFMLYMYNIILDHSHFQQTLLPFIERGAYLAR